MRLRSRLLTNWARSAGKICEFAGRRTQHLASQPARRVRLMCQPLEGRIVPATWVAQGPSTTNNGQVVLPPNNSINGGIQTIAPHPTNADILYVGAVNGGVWKTTNATAASPTWTPLTDNFPSQSIGDIQFDPTDATAQTLIVGTGRWSNFARYGDDEVGLYYTTNGGASFTQFNDPLLTGRTTSSVIARGTTLIASSALSGVVRSTNGGTSWVNISGLNGLNSGGVSTIVGDPTNNNRLYAAVTGKGVFHTDNLGNTWTNVSSGLTGVAASPYVRLAVNASAGVVFVAVPGTGQGTATAVFRSTDQGGAWTPMDMFVVHNGKNIQSVNTSIAAHPTNSNRVYIGGDRIAASPFTASIASGNAALSAGSQWVTIVDGNASNTTPHADSRDMEFDANGNLLESNDGGIARRSSPHTTAGSWVSIGGNIQAMEVHDVAWNAVNNTVMIGTQDNGNHMQPTSGATTWNNITANSGDGGDVAIDSVSLAGSNQAIRYYSTQNLGSFSRQVIDSTNTVVSTTSLATISGVGFVTPIEINTINPSRLLIGGSSALFESTDQGTSNTSLGFPGVSFLQNAMVYGGTLNGTPNADLIYFGSGNFVYKRTTSGGAITATSSLGAGAGTIRDVAVDPSNYNTVFVVDDDQVFNSVDGGTTWLDITANLGIVSPGLDLRTITYVQGKGGYASYVAIGTRSGVFASSNWRAPESIDIWTGIRMGMPDVPVFDLIYNATDDILVAGTLGRSVWTLSSASIELAPSLMVNTDSNALDDNDGLTSLREAVRNANFLAFANTITFSNFFNTPRTITLTTGELPINEAVTINGPGSGLLTISGNNNSRIFNTDAAVANAGVTIRGLTLTAGKGTDGGAIYVGNENLTVEDSVIFLCSASEDGGAINVQNAGTLNLLRCTVTGNTSADDGGGIYINVGGSVDIIESAIINNQATNGNGGGLYFFGTVAVGGLRALSSTIAGNSSGLGGAGIALVSFTGNLDVINSTVTGNITTTSSGGGIARVSGTGTINLVSTIVSGNTGSSFPDVFSSGTVNVEYSAIGSTSGFTPTGANNIIGQDLKLRSIANNGGPTPSIAFEFDSPLRGKGTPPGPFTSKNDQRGLPRDSNGPDVGAFELQTTVVNANNSGVGSLRDAVAESNRVVGLDTIYFGSAFNNVQTITLLTGEVALTDAVTINGNGATLTQISGNTFSRIFNTTAIPAAGVVTLRGLSLIAGYAADGGAITVGDEYLIVEDSGISNSSATGNGGAIQIGFAGKLTLNRSTLSGNTANGTGGAIRFHYSESSDIIASSIIGNKASSGGAISLSGIGGTFAVVNSTLSGNTATSTGGGGFLADFFGTLLVRNSTLTGNTAGSKGGGIANNGYGAITVESTIVSGNGAPTGPDISSTTKLTVNSSAIGSTAGFTFTGANNLPFGSNLKLAALANNGGSTLTHLPANDSPLINAGSNPAALALDQRGVVRTLFGTIDIGSVESTNAPPDTTAPTITNITSGTPNGSYGPGSPIDIIVNFSEAVTLVGTLNVLFNNGGVGTITAQQPNFSTLTGTYQVAAGQATPDLNVTGFSLTSGSTLLDGAGNIALFTLPATNFGFNKDIVITTPDVSAPTITSITSPTPNGTYQAGATIGVTLNFSEPVTLSGFLFVFFDSGGSLLIQGPQTNDKLSGTYTVGTNQNSPDLNVTAVALDNTSFLTDSAGNPAVLSLPASNLANNSNIVVGTPIAMTFTVTNTKDDSNPGSLRRAVLDANASPGYDVIVFDASFDTAKTITLSTQLDITEAVAITGKGAALTTIQGGGSNRLILTQNAPAGAAINISGLTLSGGRAGNGGGVFIGDESITLSNAVLSNNSVSGLGGAITVQAGGTIKLLATTLSGNTASFGGGISIFNGSADIRDSTLVNNTATNNQGGGLYFGGTVGSGGLRLLNSTVSGNKAGTYGGGVGLRSFNGKFEAISSTITNNTSSYLGGGIARSDTGTGTIFLRSTIVSGNTATVGGHDLYSTTIVDAFFSAIGKSGGFTLSNPNGFNLDYGTDLKLGALAANGGPTLTHRPTGDSPLLNAGTNYYNVANDQRGSGFPRVINGTPDIGAVEVAMALPTVVLNANDSGTGSLRQAILNANSNVGADTVSFDPTFFATPRTINLGGTHLVLTDTSGTTTITGPGVNLLTVSGNNLSRAFLINSGVSGAISGMTIANGNSTYGGALQNSGAVTVSNSRFTNNKSDYGGAIFSVGVLSVSNSSFDNNAANFGTGWGGAIINGTTAGAANIAACTFTNNYASSLGGAVIGYSFNISNSTFTNNTSGLNGGALRSDGTVTITGSTFSGNSAANDGGAIMSHGTTTITNSTLTSNTASIGGGIFFFEGAGTMRNVTVAYNTSTNTAGNIGGGTQVGTAASVTAVNTIVAGNTAASGLNAGGSFNASSSNNLLNLSAADAGLGTLANNGGLTQTIALLPGSPAINAGTSVGTPTTDQRGSVRLGATDIGAFEVQTLLPAKVVQITINGGAVQRSRVTSVAVTFTHPVSFTTTPTAAFQLQRQSDGKFPNVSASVNAARDVVTLTFLAGDAVDFGSLADGRYTLTVNAAAFASDGFDGDGNGTAGDNYTLVGNPATNKLFRLFGDSDGDGTVATNDFIAFRLALGGTSATFDFDNDGAVAASDFIQFRLRFGGSI